MSKTTVDTCTIWVCSCCMFVQNYGECCSDEHGSENYPEPLALVAPADNLTDGLTYEEHDATCLFHPDNPATDTDGYECSCATREFSWSSCEGCGSPLAGRRHAMTLWIGENT